MFNLRASLIKKKNGISGGNIHKDFECAFFS